MLETKTELQYQSSTNIIFKADLKTIHNQTLTIKRDTIARLEEAINYHISDRYELVKAYKVVSKKIINLKE